MNHILAGHRILKQNIHKMSCKIRHYCCDLISLFKNKLGVEKGWFILLCFISIGLAASNIAQLTVMTLW